MFLKLLNNIFWDAYNLSGVCSNLDMNNDRSRVNNTQVYTNAMNGTTLYNRDALW